MAQRDRQWSPAAFGLGLWMLAGAAMAALTALTAADSPYTDGYPIPPLALLGAAGALSVLGAFARRSWILIALAAIGAALFTVTLLHAQSRAWPAYLIGAVLGLLPVLAAWTAARARHRWPPHPPAAAPAPLMRAACLVIGSLITLTIGTPALMALLRGVLPYDWIPEASLLDQPATLTTFLVGGVGLACLAIADRTAGSRE